MIERRANRLGVSIVLVMLLSLGACTGPQATRVPPLADHHVHLRSEIAAVDLPRVQLARGYSHHELSPGLQDADDLIRQLDQRGIHYAAILSLGYMYALPDINFEDEYARVRRENDFTAEQAAAYPHRLVAFCGISPLADYALKEIERCAGLSVVGIKMHMANSGVELDRDSHFQALADAVARANALDLALVIHLRPRGPRYDKAWVQQFLDEIMPLAPDVTVQLAHMGGGGGMDRATRQAVAVLAAGASDFPNLYFDLSGAFLRDQDVPATHKGPPQQRMNRRAVADAIRQLDPERVLFGSDWDSLRYRDTLEPAWRMPGLSRESLKTVLCGLAPYFLTLKNTADPRPTGHEAHTGCYHGK